jgi:hypothetical protein
MLLNGIGWGMVRFLWGQAVAIHPSHICQIGESDQGLIVWPSNPLCLPHGCSNVIRKIN